MASHARNRMMWRRFRANLRDARVVLREFRGSLLFFVAVLFGAALLYRTLAIVAQASIPAVQVPSLVESVYLMLSMIFLQANVDFPEPWYLEIFFFAMPVIGLALLGTGVANLGALLFNKSARGREWEASLASTFSNHVILVGLGKLGYRIVQQLLDFGQEVVAVELDPDKPFIPLARELGVPVLIADGRREDTLEAAGIDRAVSILCCTQDDLANLDIALDAQQRRPDIRVVLRMFDAELARKVERGFGIHTAFSTSGLAAPAFAAAATRAHIEYSFYVDGQLLHVAQVPIESGSPLVGQTVEEVERQYNLTVVMHRRPQERHLHPQSDEVLNAGDGIVVVASLEVLGRIGSAPDRSERGALPDSRNWLRRLVGGVRRRLP